MRNFSPFAGHSWANGFATFPFGNDQESTSESMQFASSLIHWGAITGNQSNRDLGVYIYTTEQSAIEEYWFDMEQRNFKSGYGYALASRAWGNGYDNQTFWTGDIAAAYGIELYPIHGGSLYLGQNIAYGRAPLGSDDPRTRAFSASRRMTTSGTIFTGSSLPLRIPQRPSPSTTAIRTAI